MYSGYTKTPEVKFTPEARERIINRESDCTERRYVMLTAAARAYKSPLPRNEYMARVIDNHESDCQTCWIEAGLDPDVCRHGAEACVECSMEAMNL